MPCFRLDGRPSETYLDSIALPSGPDAMSETFIIVVMSCSLGSPLVICVILILRMKKKLVDHRKLLQVNLSEIMSVPIIQTPALALVGQGEEYAITGIVFAVYMLFGMGLGWMYARYQVYRRRQRTEEEKKIRSDPEKLQEILKRVHPGTGIESRDSIPLMVAGILMLIAIAAPVQCVVWIAAGILFIW